MVRARTARYRLAPSGTPRPPPHILNAPGPPASFLAAGCREGILSEGGCIGAILLQVGAEARTPLLLPPQAATRREIRPLTSEESLALFEAASGDRLEALYVLAVAAGLRQGELLALTWGDVELEDAVLRVRRTLTRTGGKVEAGPPKTPNSRRTVGLTTRAVDALRAHLSRQLEEIEEKGGLYRSGGLVFATEVGGIINPSNLRNRHFPRVLARARLPKIRFHDLRHTCATLLLTQNVNPKIVSEMLGHSSISVTLDTYSHVLPTMRENAVRALEKALK